MIDEPWELGGVRLPNRAVLAPLAGIGNCQVRITRRAAKLTTDTDLTDTDDDTIPVGFAPTRFRPV